MTADYMRKKWGVTLKVARDRAKIIPLAKKEKGRWIIPDVDIPPISSHTALVLLQLIDTCKKGGKTKLL